MSTSMTKMAWEKRYEDDSGVEHAVRFDANKCEIEFEAIDKIQFPQSDIDWLIQCLQEIKKEQGL